MATPITFQSLDAAGYKFTLYLGNNYMSKGNLIVLWHKSHPAGEWSVSSKAINPYFPSRFVTSIEEVDEAEKLANGKPSDIDQEKMKALGFHWSKGAGGFFNDNKNEVEYLLTTELNGKHTLYTATWNDDDGKYDEDWETFNTFQEFLEYFE